MTYAPRVRGNLLKCGAQMAVEHDSQSFLFYPRAVCHGTRPIEHDASKIVMHPGTRHDGHDFRLLAVAWAAAGNEYADNEQPKHTPTC